MSSPTRRLLKTVQTIQKRIVKQHPNLGVRTKNGKHATTYLLDLPELLSVVQEWDQLIRSVLPDHGYWFSPFSPETGNIDPNNLECPKSRCSLVNRQLKLWQREHGLQEYSPHKFRHGHVHYGMNNSRNISDYKAVSMNVMHSSMEITDEFYSVLNDNELQNRIQNLGKQLEQAGTDEEILQKIRELLR